MARLALLLLVLLSTTGCSDTAFDPFDNDQRYFTIYGFLDQLEVNHSVRVIAVTRNAENILTPTEDNRIDARVFSTDLTTGDVREWTHDFQRLEDGTYGHVFRSRFIVQPGRRYRLEVVRQDEKMAWAETQVPTIPDAALVQRNEPVFNADSTQANMRLTIPRIASPWDINAIYLMHNQNNGSRPGGGALQAYMLVPYGRSGSRMPDGSWEVVFDLTKDTREIRQRVADFRAAGAYDNTPETATAMGIQVRILDQWWDPPEGNFDPEVLAQPGTMSNVVQGYGLWGSIGIYRQEWAVPRELARALGYEW
ncbi:MAG: DUF4249 family protein [Rhodothermales bacterium]|nr:DUF4249 family protein [Rhodothermales bacterium]MBO6778162.1 DUF4249 family protein [Rhodothermales bacterium]